MTAGPCASLAKIELIIDDERNHPPRRSEAQPHWFPGMLLFPMLPFGAGLAIRSRDIPPISPRCAGDITLRLMAQGRSNTCTREATCPGAPANPAPQPAQQDGSTGSRWSGVATGPRPLPRCPGCPPCLRRGRPGSSAAGCPSGDCWDCRPAGRLPAFAFAFAPGPSVLGGCEEFEESRPTCRRNASNSTRNASINTACAASSAACSATRTANSAYEGVAGGSDTARVKHDQTPDTSTDTPQVSRGSDWLRCE